MMGTRDCSVTRLAQDLDVSRRSLSGYFSGKKDLKAETLVRILDYLGMDLRKMAYKKVLLEMQGVSDDPELQSDLGILLHSLSPLEQRTFLQTLIAKTKTSANDSVAAASSRLSQRLQRRIENKRREVC